MVKTPKFPDVSQNLCMKKRHNHVISGVQPFAVRDAQKSTACLRVCIQRYPECKATVHFFTGNFQDNLCLFYNKSTRAFGVELDLRAATETKSLTTVFQLTGSCNDRRRNSAARILAADGKVRCELMI